MFRKLKIQLTLINLVSLSIVLIIIFSGVYTLMKTNIDNQSKTYMSLIARRERILSNNFGRGQKTLVPRGPEDRRILSNCFYIKTSSDRAIIEVSTNVNISSADAKEIIKAAFSKSSQQGSITYKETNLKYLIAPKPYGYIVVFLDRNHDNDVLRWLILASIIIGSLSIILVLAISLLLADRALIPIKNSWEKQRSFVADASHELRTPLAVISTNLEVVLDNKTETIESQSDWLENIQSEVKRMSKLVEDLLFVARSDGNASSLEMKDFNLTASLMQLIELFKPFCMEKDIKLRTSLEPDVYILGNEGRIKQLVTNLIDNAVQHTQRGGEINLAMQRKDFCIEIIVKDNGSGISEEHLSRIFQRFYKADKARTNQNNGSGLGLSIAECIAKEHKGSISVSSVINEGSTFTVILPQIKDNK